jgi:hypothetical protein
VPKKQTEDREKGTIIGKEEGNATMREMKKKNEEWKIWRDKEWGEGTMRRRVREEKRRGGRVRRTGKELVRKSLRNKEGEGREDRVG